MRAFLIPIAASNMHNTHLYTYDRPPLDSTVPSVNWHLKFMLVSSEGLNGQYKVTPIHRSQVSAVCNEEVLLTVILTIERVMLWWPNSMRTDPGNKVALWIYGGPPIWEIQNWLFSLGWKELITDIEVKWRENKLLYWSPCFPLTPCMFGGLAWRCWRCLEDRAHHASEGSGLLHRNEFFV